MAESHHSRRDFLNPTALGSENFVTTPKGGSTVRVSTRAMACEFAVIMNPGPAERTTGVGDILELVHDIESWLSVYKSDSEITHVNRRADREPVVIRREFLELLQLSCHLHQQTDGAFDITAGAQIQLWRDCRQEHRIPTDDEVAKVCEMSGSSLLELDDQASTVRFRRAGMALDAGGIGKGFALDEAARWMPKLEHGADEFLLHGGHSSLIARGCHNHQDGWPVGIGNPLLTKKRLGTVLLRDQAMSTSGSNIQFFRYDGQRYGHILDPRTARPAGGMLSVTVFADSAAVADALSTAFFVLGVENAQKCCDNLPNVGAILIPFPEQGKQLTPTVIGVPSDRIFWEDQVSDPGSKPAS